MVLRSMAGVTRITLRAARRLGLAGGLALGALALTGVPADAGAATPRPTPAHSARLPVAGGLDTRRALAVTPAAPQTRLHVTFTLTPRDPAALAAYAQAVSTPGAGAFRRFLTPAAFARRFGAAPARIRAVRAWLRARGLIPGATSAGGLSIPVTAAVGTLQRGLDVALESLRLPGGRTALTVRRAPLVPAAIASAIQSVVGLNTVGARRPLIARHPATRHTAVRPAVVTGGPQPCSAARSAASAQGSYTADQIASAYGFSGLYGAGNTGAGTTVAMYELEPVSASDLAAYAGCYGVAPSISYVPVDGGAGSGAGSGEAALDIENLMGLAPGARILVYQGPNSNSGAPGSGPYDTFSAIINQDRAQVVSVSWGECEAALGTSDAQAESALFQQAAVQGQTVVSASGDSGSEDCDAGGTLPQTQLAVDDPASQPDVLGVGGTKLSTLGPRPAESVWNDGGNLSSPLLQPGAGGGGISQLWTIPAAQRDAAPGLNVLAAGTTGSQCGAPGGYCREVPDVSADADPTDGYTIYFNGSGSSPGNAQGWQAIGGTSGAAPVWAALIDLADAQPACQGAGLGDVLPALYRAAGDDYAATFNDVRTGDNDYTGTHAGQYTAGPGYDEASGLGSPNAAALAPALCADSLRLATPPQQRSAAAATVSLQLRAQDAPGLAVQFLARGLPPGLALNPATGLISGRPSRAGHYLVSVSTHDATGVTAGTGFGWVVGSATRLVNPTLTTTGRHSPSLHFTVTAGNGAPALLSLTITLPSGLRAARTRGLTVTAGDNARAPVTVRRVGSGFVLRLRRGYRTLHVTLAAPAIARTGRSPHSRGRSSGSSSLTLAIGDQSGGASTVRGRPRTVKSSRLSAHRDPFRPGHPTR